MVHVQYADKENRLLLPKLNIKFLINKNKKLYRNSMKMSLSFASFTNFFTENVWELVTAPTRQNGVKNRDRVYWIALVINTFMYIPPKV